jgi:potassium-transporting ATPase KdpC subunit
MIREIGIALRATVATLLLTGGLYPLLVTGIAQLLFPNTANGSLVKDDRGRVVGSLLIAQGFSRPAYLQPRPSAAAYDAAASRGSNLGPTSRKLHERAAADVGRLRAGNPEAAGLVPGELVAASASGLDPDLSPAGALWQAPRIARARGVELLRVEALIRDQVEGRPLGVLGEPRVNVLAVNLALDRRFGAPPE